MSIDSNLAIALVNDSRITCMFVKANDYVLTKYLDEFKKSQDDVKVNLLKECWQKEFNAQLNLDDLAIMFVRKKDMTLFLLRWS